MRKLILLSLCMLVMHRYIDAIESPLIKAVKDNDINQTETLLKTGANINEVCEFDTPLIQAVKNQNPALVELLLNNGADVNLPNHWGDTPLSYAVKSNNDILSRYLLTKGANANSFNNLGETPLFYAITNKNIDLVLLLLKHGGNCNHQAHSGFSPFTLACSLFNDEMIKIMLPYKPDINARIQYKSNYFNQDTSGPVLWFFINYEKHELATLLVQLGAQLTADEKGTNPLFYAIERGYDDLTLMILSRNSAIDVTDKNGISLLFCAVRNGRKKIADILLQRGAPLLQKTSKGNMLLAAIQGYPELAEKMIRKKYFINDDYTQSITPLYVACMANKPHLVRLLLENGYKIPVVTTAIPNDFQKDYNDHHDHEFSGLYFFAHSPLLLLAIKNNSPEIVQLLKDYSKSSVKEIYYVPALFYAATELQSSNDRIAMIRLLLKNREDINTTYNGMTLLHYECRSNRFDTELIDEYLSQGIDIDALDQTGHSALYYCLIKLLHAHNGDSSLSIEKLVTIINKIITKSKKPSFTDCFFAYILQKTYNLDLLDERRITSFPLSGHESEMFEMYSFLFYYCAAPVLLEFDNFLKQNNIDLQFYIKENLRIAKLYSFESEFTIPRDNWSIELFHPLSFTPNHFFSKNNWLNNWSSMTQILLENEFDFHLLKDFEILVACIDIRTLNKLLKSPYANMVKSNSTIAKLLLFHRFDLIDEILKNEKNGFSLNDNKDNSLLFSLIKIEIGNWDLAPIFTYLNIKIQSRFVGFTATNIYDDSIEYLLKRHYKYFYKKNSQGINALHWAVIIKNVKFIEALLTIDFPLNERDSEGNTALMLACKSNRSDIVKMLLDKKVKTKLNNKNGETALDISIKNQNRELINLLKSFEF